MDAAVRELFEETSVRANSLNYITNVDVIEKDETGAIQFHFLIAAVLCDYVSGEPTAHDDVSEARWWMVDGRRCNLRQGYVQQTC